MLHFSINLVLKCNFKKDDVNLLKVKQFFIFNLNSKYLTTIL